MANEYSGDPGNTGEGAGSSPSPFGDVVITIPADTDPMNVATMFVTQNKTTADNLQYLQRLEVRETWQKIFTQTQGTQNVAERLTTYEQWTLDSSANQVTFTAFNPLTGTGGSGIYPFMMLAPGAASSADGFLYQTQSQFYAGSAGLTACFDVVACRDAASSNTVFFLGMDGYGPLFTASSGSPQISYGNYAVFSGSRVATEAMYFSLTTTTGDETTATWKCVTKNSGGTTTTDSGVTANTTLQSAWQHFRITLDVGNGEAKFYIDDDLVATNVDHLPGDTTLKMSFGIRRNSAGGTKSIMAIGPAYLSYNYGTG